MTSMLEDLPDTLAFVDIETTGGSLASDRIIEIGILRVENNKLVDSFSSLVNPETRVSPFIEGLTGITGRELVTAPAFSELKSTILERLEGAVFVAHNVRFDYGFLRHEFARHHTKFTQKHFCTIKLFKALYPGLSEYNLDALIGFFGLKCTMRHRALGDAHVLWDFYKKVLKKFERDVLVNVIYKAMRRPALPIHLPEQTLDQLPETPNQTVTRLHQGNNA